MTSDSDPLSGRASASEIASAVRSRQVSAAEVALAAISRIERKNEQINAFTDVTAKKALAAAQAVDRAISEGRDPGPLAGAPFAVKNLFDIAGLATRAGSKINRDRAPASQDAVLVRRMQSAGALLTGALNMGEYAYDFTGENVHDGNCRNPHALDRMSGGSSSGSGAATAAGLAPISLGTDTNGSLRVPASLCGVFSLKPTYGRLPRTGTFAFVDSLDHVGPLARTASDLALAYDVLKGPDLGDHASVAGPEVQGIDRGSVAGLRIGLPTGWLQSNYGADAQKAMETVSETLRVLGAEVGQVALDGAEAGRSAAFLITNAESSALHLDRLRDRAQDFDPDTRDRFLAGALLPASWIVTAQRVRAIWLAQAMEAFRAVDILLVPATPVSAPLIGEDRIVIDGKERPLRPNLGLLAQPFSCIGLPVVTAPVFDKGSLPIGVQIIARPWAERLALDVAETLERVGVSVAHYPPSEVSAEAQSADLQRSRA